ncbi:hypothetical protein MKW94_012360 [Papaver nudicaule]|uniref:ABC transmembrane type-1 domain-containing protein n=1 Tax=Papaver nudicaule TaxID=74823 RepID=A0AA41S5R1_PAPNU|nr:hypothetical protein [Papaver nudicaule]
MEIPLGVVNGIGFSLLLTWIAVVFWKENKLEDHQDGSSSVEQKSSSSKNSVLVSNISISISYLSLCSYDILKLKTVSVGSVLWAIAWILVTFFVLISRNRRIKWPVVLICWWTYSAFLITLSISIHLLTYLQYSFKFLNHFRAGNVADFAAFPFSLFLCFNSLCSSYNKMAQELEKPLLHEEVEDVDDYTKAGLWSQLTFCWLNPIFQKAQTRKLELHHIPPVPESENTESSFALLEKSISNQKSGAFSMSTALFHAIWRPLAVNAVMGDGEVVQCGKYEDLVANPDGELVRQMTAHRKSLSQVTAPEDSNVEAHKPNKMVETEVTEEKSDSSRNCGKHADAEEETETGRVKWRVYSYFLTSAYKGALIPVLILCQVLFQGLQMGSNYWIAWATETEERVSNAKLIGVFALLSGGSSVFILGRAFLLATVSIETAQRLFLQMINSVFRAPISFFDSTPSSRILNRSSTDQSSVDTDIPYRLAGLAFALIQLMSIIILMSQVAWQVIILFVVVVAISIWYQAYYISAARELARMVGVWKSPILHHFSESIAGAVPIRCFNQEDRFLATNISLIDNYCRLAFHNCATMEWLCVRINFLFNLVFFLVLVILVNLPKEAISPSKLFSMKCISDSELAKLMLLFGRCISRLGRIGSYVRSESQRTTSLGDMEPLQR